MVSQLETYLGVGTVTTIPLNEANNTTYGSPQIQSIRNNKECQVMTVPIPTEDSSAALGFDFLGVKREITINGIVVGTTAQIEAFMDAVENMINGDQFNTPTFTHSISAVEYKEGISLSLDYNTRKDYLVIIKSFSHNYNKGAPGKLDYTLNMVEKVNTATQV